MRWATVERVAHNGVWLPAGMRVEVVTLTGTGGPHGEHNRDGGTKGDGQRIVVTYPNSIEYGEVRTLDGLAALGIEVSNLQEVS